MKLPDEVRAWLTRRYASQHRDWLAARAGEATQQEHWPLTIPLGLPTEAAALRQPEAVRAWTASWRGWRGAGELRWVERRWKVLGVQTLPEALILHDPAQVAVWADQQDRWRRALPRHAQLVARWPALAPRLPRWYEVLADYAEEDFQRLQDLLAWLAAHPASGLYPRQLPLAGMDSKWLEPRKAVVADLTAALGQDGAGLACDDGDKGRDFHAVCGLKRPPALVRLRVLDPALRTAVGGMSDISAPVEALAGIPWRPAIVIIVENLQTGLALEHMRGAVAFMALGYAVDALMSVPWLACARCLYWGDIDTHGYAILHQACGFLPRLESVMMDEATLRRFAALWTREKVQHGADDLARLTPAERGVYTALRANLWGQSLRLEQERIDWSVARAALTAAADAGG